MYCPLLGGIQEEYREGHQHMERQAHSHQGGQQRHQEHWMGPIDMIYSY